MGVEAGRTGTATPGPFCDVGGLAIEEENGIELKFGALLNVGCVNGVD